MAPNGKCVFNNAWLEKEYWDWILQCPDRYKAKCCVCMKNFDVSDSPARRADFTRITGSIFPKKFCAVRWLENSDCIARSIEIVEPVMKYLSQLKYTDSKLKASLKMSMKDPFIKCKLAFVTSLSLQCETFLTNFQSEKVRVPYLYAELSHLLGGIIKKFVKLEKVVEGSALLKLDLNSKDSLLEANNIDIGFGAKKYLKEFKIAEKTKLFFFLDCQKILLNLAQKIIDKSPLKYKLVRGISSLHPSVILNNITNVKVCLSFCLFVKLSRQNYQTDLDENWQSCRLKPRNGHRLEQDAAASLIKENNNLKDKIQILEFDNEKNAETIKALNEKITCFENDCKKYEQMCQDITASNSRRELRSPNVPETLSTIIYADEQTSRETLERKEHEPRQDMETKDERIKRLARKGETFKNKNGELLQEMVEHLRGNVERLEKEKSNLKEKLEYYESNFGSTFDDISVPRGLNSIKKESDRIGSANDDVSESSHSTKYDKKMDGQLLASVSDDSQHSRTESFSSNPEQCAQLGLSYDITNLLLVIKRIRKKNCITSAVSKTLKENCAKIKDRKEFSARLRDLFEALDRAGSSVITRSRSHAARDADANPPIGKCKTLGQETETFEHNLGSMSSNKTKDELKMTIKNLEEGNENLMKDVEKLRQEVAIAQEKYINMEKLAKKKDDDVKKALIMITLRISDKVVLSTQNYSAFRRSWDQATSSDNVALSSSGIAHSGDKQAHDTASDYMLVIDWYKGLVFRTNSAPPSIV
ncbi:hypothetical protein AVEN_26805-1 [Araneus ventricosus]|uniref:Uncharacterized protein n=1 Tax=Araneus ventricosus TaxID=182803 RepID=A0A4Y2IXQ5_ARAVE|nr:hypothetical protein AVEN_26805-1 [Araneus ventricosus]